MDSDEPTSPPPPPPPSPPAQPGAAVLFAFLIFLAQAFAQDLVIAGFYGLELNQNPHVEIEEWLKDLQFDGNALSLCTLASMVVGVPLIILAARRVSGNAKEFLAIRWPTARNLAGWLLMLIAFVALTDAVSAYFRHDVVPDFMQNAYDSAHPRILLWIALLIAAPVSEELLFRGLLFSGLAQSQLRPEGAALVSSLAWAALHVQYDLYLMTSVFVTGLLLATARHYSRSTLLCIILHSVMNLIATVELLVTTQGG